VRIFESTTIGDGASQDVTNKATHNYAHLKTIQTYREALFSGAAMKNRFVQTLALWCAFSTLTAMAAPDMPEVKWPIKRLGLSGAKARPGDVVVTLRSTSSGWLIDMNASLASTDTEQLWIRPLEDAGHIVVLAQASNIAKETGRSLCLYGAMGDSAQKHRAAFGYTECTSAFYKCETTLTDAIMLLPYAVTASRMCPMQLNAAKVHEALESAKVFEWLQALQVTRRREVQLAAYRSEFQAIASTEAAEKFTSRYANDDPEGLVPQVNSQLNQAAANALDRAQREQAEKARLEELKERQRQEQERLREANLAEQRRLDDLTKQTEQIRLKKTLEFRKKIAIGSDTFCGPVINLRGPMVQVAVNAQLQGFSPEPWLKLEDVYPASIAGCRNVNGRLEPIWVQ